MQSEECWDDADAPAYTPNVEQKKIIKKTPPRMTKAQKKAFYAGERKRWELLRQQSEWKCKRTNIRENYKQNFKNYRLKSDTKNSNDGENAVEVRDGT